MCFVKPLDEHLVLRLATTHELVVTVEEDVLEGGAGCAVLEPLAAQGVEVRVLQLGLPDQFVEHGDPVLLLADCGLDATGIARAICERLAKGNASQRTGMAA